MTPESPERPPGSPRIDADVVERLRRLAKEAWATPFAGAQAHAMDAAADEIERLRDALSCIVASGAYPEAAIAQEALEATEVTQ